MEGHEMHRDREPAIETHGVSKTYGLIEAVKEVSISVAPGEVRGLVGENGAGKSTLLKMLCGITQADSGSMRKDGKPHAPHSMVQAYASGLSIILQEVGVIPSLSVAANMYLGRTNEFVRAGVILKRRLHAQVERLLRDFGVSHIDPRMPLGRLSAEDQKFIEVIRALAFTPDVLLVDETSAALPADGCELLFERIARMKADGTAVLFVSHRLREVLQVSDTVSVLRDGALVTTIASDETDPGGLRSLMVGRNLSDHYYRSDQTASCSDSVALSVSDLRLEGSLHGVTFEVHAGEIVGVGGLTGCGMHPLGKAIFGLAKRDSGTVKVHRGDRAIHTKGPVSAARCGIGYVPRDRNAEGLMLTSSIRGNICLPSHKQLLRQGRGAILKRHERGLSRKGMEQLDIKASSIEQLVIALSGGNRQKVALAKWLARGELFVLVLDCPTRGIDVGVKAYIYELMERLKERDLAIVLISEELPELIGMSDRVLIMKEGRIAREFSRSDGLHEQQLIEAMI